MRYPSAEQRERLNAQTAQDRASCEGRLEEARQQVGHMIGPDVPLLAALGALDHLIRCARDMGHHEATAIRYGEPR